MKPNNFIVLTVDAEYYLEVYGALGGGALIIQLTMDLCFLLRATLAAQKIHRQLLYNILRSPMSFFDTNPTGRITNRFSSDLDAVDQVIPFQMADFMWCLLEAIAIIIIISYTTPEFLIVAVPLLITYYLIQRYYIVSSRQLKRLYSISKSPIFSHFNETVNGASTIRAFGMLTFDSCFIVL